ncbi:MAG: Smr/MutS family protein [Syntrophobacteria bacterium]
MEITNRRILQVCRWFLLLVCLSAGGFLLLGGKSKGIGIVLLLVGLWFVLDNPLESFENLEGPCPFCGHMIQGCRRASFHCPACEETVSHPDPRISNGHGEDASQSEPEIIEPGDSLDLHTFSPKDVSSLLEEFIHLSQQANINLVNIIHGKGTGTLRRHVRNFLARDPRVLSFYDAPRKSGGWGATVVELKAHQSENDGDA